MQPSIPASEFVNVIPSALQAGAANLGMNAVFLDNTGDTSVPIGTVMAFGSALSVSNWFGPNSEEAALAGIYFAGFNGATALPGLLYFAQYNTAAVAGYLRGGNLEGVSLTQLQGFSGVLTVAVNGETVTSANINLSSATSFTNAAALIQTGLQTLGGVFSGTGSQALGVLTIASTVSGQLHVGDTVTGAGVFGGTATITSFGTYTPGAGTGTVNVSTSGTTTTNPVDVSSTATCTYDTLRQAFVITSPTTGATSTLAFPTTDAFATDLLLTAATGAVLSAGAAAATPAGLMNAIVAQTTNWATFTSVEDPDSGAAGGPIKLAFATWNSEQNNAFMYVAYDTDPTPFNSSSDPASFGSLVAALSGTFPILDNTEDQAASVAAFTCAIPASTNWIQPGGRTDFAYRSSPSVTPDVTNLDAFLNADANGYNCYAAVATRTTAFQWLQRGRVSGPFKWADSYVNQIYWNSVFQNDFAELLTNVPSIPYNQAGYGLIRGALAGDIIAMGAFGAWRSGVVLSGAQQQAVNTEAGLTIAPILQSQGWYLQVEDPGPTVRGQRGSPSVTFWYTDGDSVQQISMASIDVE